MKGQLNQFFSLLLCTTLLASGVSMPVRAESSQTLESNYIPLGHQELEEDHTASTAVSNGMMLFSNGSTLPVSYDLRDELTLPPVRSQYKETCWAYASIGLCEISMLKQGYSCDDLDYSELQHAYFTYRNPSDPLGGLVGDQNMTKGAIQNCLLSGGNMMFSMNMLASWCGATSESLASMSSAKYDTAEADIYCSVELDPQYAYGYDLLHLQNFVKGNIKTNPSIVKQMILDYGAVGISFYYNSKYYNTAYNSYYCGDSTTVNHDVIVIGWDDTKITQASTPGAWLIRNSHATPDSSQESLETYFWLSYEDCSLAETTYALQCESNSNYDNNYQYDGTIYTKKKTTKVTSGVQLANIFQVHADEDGESLEAVSFTTGNANLDYEISVYLNPTSNNPSSGTLVSSFEGSTLLEGYYTVELPEPVTLSYQDTFSVVITLSSQIDQAIKIPFEGSCKTSTWYETQSYATTGQSFYRLRNTSPWSDFNASKISGNLRIKAFTKNLSDSTTESESSETSESTIESESSESTSESESSEISETSESTFESEASEISESTFESEASETSENTFESEASETSESTFESEASETSESTFESEASETSESTFESEASETSEFSESISESEVAETSESTSESEAAETSESTSETEESKDIGDHENQETGESKEHEYEESSECSESDECQESGQREEDVRDPEDDESEETNETNETEETDGTQEDVRDDEPESIYHNICYELFGGVNSSLNPDHFKGNELPKLYAPTKIGYCFEGWYTNPDYLPESLAGNDDSILNEDITLYAKWSDLKYNIYFEPGCSNYLGTAKPIINCKFNKTITLTNPFKRNGYRFECWEDQFHNQYASGQKIKNILDGTQTDDDHRATTTTLVLTAKWVPIEYSIKYKITTPKGVVFTNPNPTIYDNTQGTIQLQPLSIPDGYVFSGWFAKSNFSTSSRVDEIGNFTKTLNLYAKITPKTYEIRYDPNSQDAVFRSGKLKNVAVTDLNLSTQSTSYEKKTSLLSLPYKRDGYRFLGWSLTPNGNAIYKNKEARTCFTSDSNYHSQITLYAQWTNENTITYVNAVNGINQVINNNPVTFTASPDNILFLDSPSRVGYDFEGWYLNSSCTKKVPCDESGNPYYSLTKNKDLKLYAKWIAHTYTIHYDPNISGTDITGNMKDQTAKYGKNLSLRSNCYKRNGYTFQGWSTDPVAHTGTYKNKASVCNLLSEDHGIITLYAVWKPNTYKITYSNATVGKNDVIRNLNPTSYTTESTVELVEPIRAGYQFEGWYTDKKYKNKISSISGSTCKNLTLYAKWSVKQ